MTDTRSGSLEGDNVLIKQKILEFYTLGYIQIKKYYITINDQTRLKEIQEKLFNTKNDFEEDEFISFVNTADRNIVPQDKLDEVLTLPQLTWMYNNYSE